MDSHELARLLLSLPNRPAVIGSTGGMYAANTAELTKNVSKVSYQEYEWTEDSTTGTEVVVICS